MAESKTDTEHSAVDHGAVEKINREYEKTLAIFPSGIRQKKEKLVTDTFRDLSQKIIAQGNFDFTEERQAILKLKLARYFQKKDSLSPSTLFDAIVETPKFLDKAKGSFFRLLELHQQKTLERIAEARKRRAEMGDKSAPNPWENLFTTKSGNYYMARLLNMPHLEAESDYMRHCVGRGIHGSHYLREIQNGDIEILSFRNMPKLNPRTKRLEGDTPVITIEYNLRTNTIQQMKKQDDEYLTSNDPYYKDVIDALRQLRTTQTDSGKLRNFVKIAPSELENIKVRDGYVLTENGEAHFRNFNPDSGEFVFKLGEMAIEPGTQKQDAAKIVRLVEGITINPDEIALDREQVSSKTRMYIGKLFPEFFKWLPDSIEHVYTSFPEGKIIREVVVAGGKTGQEYEKELKQKGINIGGWAKDILESRDFTTLSKQERVYLIRTTVGGLGFTDNPTTDQLFQRACELGLEYCPPEVGPEYLFKMGSNLELYEWRYIGMKPIADSGSDPYVFGLGRDVGGLWLYSRWAYPGSRWDLVSEIVFRFRK